MRQRDLDVTIEFGQFQGARVTGSDVYALSARCSSLSRRTGSRALVLCACRSKSLPYSPPPTPPASVGGLWRIALEVAPPSHDSARHPMGCLCNYAQQRRWLPWPVACTTRRPACPNAPTDARVRVRTTGATAWHPTLQWYPLALTRPAGRTFSASGIRDSTVATFITGNLERAQHFSLLLRARCEQA